MRSAIISGGFAIALVIACGGSSATIDAGSDAAIDVQSEPAPIMSFCSMLTTAPIFCDDFDDGSLTKWSVAHNKNGAIGVTTADSTSAPVSMSSIVNAGEGHAYVTNPFTDTGLTHVSFAFDILPDAACFVGTDINSGLVGVVTGVFTSSTASYSTSLFIAGTVATIYEGYSPITGDAGAGGQYVNASTVGNGVWAHVEMDVDLRGGNKTVTTIVNGMSPTVSPLMYAPDTLDNPLITLGLDAAVSHPTHCAFLFDNFVFDGGK